MVPVEMNCPVQHLRSAHGAQSCVHKSKLSCQLWADGTTEMRHKFCRDSPSVRIASLFKEVNDEKLSNLGRHTFSGLASGGTGSEIQGPSGQSLRALRRAGPTGEWPGAAQCADYGPGRSHS